MKPFLIFCLLLICKNNFGQLSNCSNWLITPSKPSAVNIGKVAVPGNKLTVEATIYQIANNPVFNTGDIVSKHTQPSDDNYLLRTNYASIATTNGFFQTPDICTLENNKTYHVAMVYDGASLKFYRNGFLMSQIAASGDLIQNDFDTRIGYYGYEYFNTQFFGYINNVRIWKVARTLSELQTYMAILLPNPTSQAGLLANYTFDNLINKQGNTSWNGKLVGNAQINQKLPICNYVFDSCGINVNPVIINDYTEVMSFDNCTNELIVSNSAKYNQGDTVVIIQMKGAVIDASNTANFGNITNYKNAGNYEYNIIKQKTGKSLGLLHVLERQYDIENGKVQLIRVPYYKNTTINSTLSCLPWDGSKGGVLVLNVENALELNADIDVSAKGFKGGKTSTDSIISCDVTGYIFPNFNESIAALKGEGIHNTNTLLSGKGKLANGGGGGNSSNSGGAGGGNGGMGGMGGNSYVQCNVFDNGGVPGSNLIYSNANNKVFMGGGGGAGQENDFPALGPGGNGGGIIILNCTSIKTNGFSIKSNGETPQHITGSNDDGRSGGGAGGTILLNYSSASGNVAALANGGDGDYCAPPPPNAAVHGPGGGGGGGVIWLKPSTNSGTTLSVNGGINGTNITLGNNPWGATPGKTGVLLNNLKPIIDQTIFIKNIDSVRITSKIHDCRSVDFKGIGYTRNSPINNWSWNFGDGDKDNSQNPTHIYAKSGVYNVKLIGTDINGCKDSILKTITFTDITITKSKDTSVCGSMPIQLFASGGISYSWTPAASLSNASIANPVATPLLSTKYYVLVTNETGCTKKDSVNIKVNNFPDIIKSNDTTICKGSKAFLSVSGGSVYSWSPAGTLNNSSIANPIANPTVPTTYNVKVTNDEGCSKTATIKVDLFPTSTITKSNDTLICKNYSVKLFASGGVSYLWSPASLLNNATSYSPVTSALSSNTIFKVKIIDQYSCVYNDSVKVTVRPEANFAVSPNSSLCINSSIKLSASGGDNYSWSPATFIDNPLINKPTVYPKTTTTFSVIISEKTCGKKDTLFTTVEVLPLPSIVAVSSNDISCALQSTNLSVKGAGTSFSWSPSASLNDPVSPNPIASPKINTVYSVIVKDKNGCINKDSVLVKVSPAKTFFGLPNSFTPNGDGRNDCYGVSAFGPFTELSFSIYNRWGQLVFHTDKADKCWDGTFKGEPQGTGVFAYVIVAKSTCGLINEKGTVTLIR